MFVYLEEQFASKTELDKEPENQAPKQQLQNVANSSDSHIRSILNLRITVTDNWMLDKHGRGSNINTVLMLAPS